MKLKLGIGEMVTHSTLTATFTGSSPVCPAPIIKMEKLNGKHFPVRHCESLTVVGRVTTMGYANNGSHGRN